MEAAERPITELLRRAAAGERGLDDQLARAVVDELERIAERQMSARHGPARPGLTLEPRMLAHDALLKLLESPRDFENRRHFFAYATQVMVRALIDYQRARSAKKRGGDRVRLTLSGLDEQGQGTVEIEEIPAVLKELEALDPRKAEVVQLRVFWGLSMREIARVVDLSVPTAERDWRFARRWLAARLGGGDERRSEERGAAV